MFNVIPPTGVPFGWNFVFHSDQRDQNSFRDELGRLLGGDAFLTCSGKAALYLVLKTARRIYPNRNEVIIPDYTCWSVPSAVVRAGLKVRPVDIEIETLGLSPQKLETSINGKTLAVVVTHLFAMPSRIDEIEKICKRANVLLIDDAAQGFGASVDQKPLGSFGDAGILSFGRGKNITTISGGAALIRHRELSEIAAASYSNEFPFAEANSISDMIQLSAYKILSNRYAFWLPEILPFLRIGQTTYEPEFDVNPMPECRASRGVMMLNNLNEISKDRIRKAALYESQFLGADGIIIPSPPMHSIIPYLSYPILLKDANIRRYILKKGHKLGISGMYPDTVSSIRELRPHLAENSSSRGVSSRVAQTLLTLPTHYGIDNDDLRRIADFVKFALRRKA